MLRGALIGLGKIAQTGHLPAYGQERVRGNATIVAGADPKKESREAAAQNFPHLRLYADSREMFEKEKLDFVDICATPQFHADLIESAIDRRVHILCEKPFTASLEDADRIAALLRRSGNGLVFMPCHQYRYSLVWRHFKEFLEEAGTKEGSFLQFEVFRTGADPGMHVGSPAWRTDLSVSGGGILADTGVHYLYLSLWMMGMPQEVTARTYRLMDKSGAVEDTAIVILGYEKSTVEINLTWAADRRANNARLINRRGSIVYDGTRVTRWRDSTRGELPVPDASDKSHYVAMYVDLIDEFIGRIHCGQNSADWLAEAHQSVRLLHACYSAAETGSLIRMDQTT